MIISWPVNSHFSEISKYPYHGWKYVNAAYYDWLRALHDGAIDRSKELLKRAERIPEVKTLMKDLKQGVVRRPFLLDGYVITIG